MKIRTSPESPLKVLSPVPSTYDDLIAAIKIKFPALALMDKFVITYLDDEGDEVEITDDSDLQIAYSHALQKSSSSKGSSGSLTLTLK